MLAPVPVLMRDTAAQDRQLHPRGGLFGRRGVFALAVGIALLVGSAVLLARWLTSERSIDGARLRIAEATRGTLVRDAAVTGRVVAAVSPTVYATAAGSVTLSIRAGDTVASGDVVATIASPELASELAAERATLEQLEAQLGSAKIAASRARLVAQREADEAEIAFTTASRELRGVEQTFAAGALPEIELLRAQDAVRTAEVRFANARKAAGLAARSATFDLRTVHKQHERQTHAVTELARKLAELDVRAPVDGVVGTLAVAERALVAANAPLMTIVDLGRLEVELEVPETYADDLGLGMTAEVSIGASTATGTLSVLAPEVVDHHVLARVRFVGAPPVGLRQSQRVSARILIEERPDVVMVPRGPFFDTHGGLLVYVVDDGLAVQRPIRVGTTSIASVEIAEGLEPGERVVIAGSEAFEDAATVRVLD